MAILDSLINEVAEKYGLGGKAGPLVSGLLSLVTNPQTGGLSGFLDTLRRSGLGDLVSSWVSRGANNPITPSQLETAVGGNVIERLASSVGLSTNSAGSALAFLVPKVIDLLTPDGVVPTTLPGWVSNYVGGAGTTAKQFAGAAETAAATGSSMWRTLLPLAGLVLLAFLGYRYCGQTPPEQASTAVMAPTATATPMATATVALRADLGAFMEKRLPNGTMLRIPSNGVESKLIAFIEDPKQMVNKETWFSFDRLEFETDSAVLKPGSAEQLKNMSEILKAYPQVNLKIGGYTDNVGNDAYNMKLSTERAKNTEKEIETLGVADARLAAEGYGKQHPVADNATEEGRQRNRRIDVRVTKK
ncbi:MAG: YidB family protein [Blastocatellia bacterium]